MIKLNKLIKISYSIRLILLNFTIAGLFFSCSPKINPLVGYNQIKSYNNAVYLSDNIKIEKAIEIETNTLIKSKLSLSDSVLIYNNSIFSNYKIFSFEASPLKEYNITLSTTCKDWGFKKYMLDPEFRILNQKGQQIKTASNTKYFNTPYLGPFSLNNVCEIRSDNHSRYFIIVYSNNEMLQEDIYYSAASSPFFKDTYVPLIYGGIIKSSLVGDFSIFIEEKTVHN